MMEGTLADRSSSFAMIERKLTELTSEYASITCIVWAIVCVIAVLCSDWLGRTSPQTGIVAASPKISPTDTSTRVKEKLTFKDNAPHLCFSPASRYWRRVRTSPRAFDPSCAARIQEDVTVGTDRFGEMPRFRHVLCSMSNSS
jgi:hypothetical protein